MKTSRNERLKIAFEHLKVSRKVYNQADFAKLLNKQVSYISELLSFSRDTSEQFIIHVHNVFPALSKEWLITGKGEMLKGDEALSDSERIVFQKRIIELMTEIDRLKSELQKK